MDQYYLVNGKYLSTFREIEKVVEKSRIEVLMSSNALKNVMNSNIQQKYQMVDSFCDSINTENRNICLNNELMNASHNQRTPIEIKNINILKYLQHKGKIDSRVKTVNDSLHYVNTNQNQQTCNNLSLPDRTENKESFDNIDSKILKVNALKQNEFGCGKNFWFKIFYYFQNKFISSAEKHAYIKKILADYPTIHERLKNFGFNLLLIENEMVDAYGFKILQKMYESQKMDFEKAKVRNKMAMEFVNSYFAENIVRACNENSCRFAKSRMKYTDNFEHVQ